jgi:cytochrome c-type biogenesis protein CcmF
MIAELGHAVLIAALILALITAISPVFFASTLRMMCRVRYASHLLMLLISAAFAALIYCHASSDFSVTNVVLNSHSTKPLLYKITGTWGNHEGSMLLWVWVLSAYGMCVAFTRPSDKDLQQKTLTIHALITAGFLAFILFTSNPFARMIPAATDGQDLNPLLQDIGLALHPPLLYFGYVGFGMVFSYAIAALWQRRIDAAWARTTQPWILLAWSTLTLGIGMGSWWAYRELGWGGWWFWDPVENVSLLPWFAGTALLHSNLMLERKNMLGGWVILLAITCFTMSLIGTFIVRSGLIMSVHAFTSDPLRGNAILLYIAAVVGGALTLYSIRRIGSPPAPAALASRTGLILVNNVLLLTITATILLSILAPLILTLLNLPTITVGAPYFNTVFFPLAAPLVLLAGVAPLLPWQRVTSQVLWQRLSPLFMFAAASVMLIFMIVERHLLLAMIAAACTGWLLSATLWQTVRRYHAIPHSEDESVLRRLRRFPLQQAGTLLSHLGLAILCGAIACTSLMRESFEATLPPSGILQMGEYTLEVTATHARKESNFEARSADIRITKEDRLITSLSPEIRYYPVRDMETSEVAIDSGLLRDVYLVISNQIVPDGKQHTIAVRLYVTPAMVFLWAGFLLIAGGGGLSLLARLTSRSHGEAV